MSSPDDSGHDKEPIIPTSGRRMGKGLLIIVITLAVGAAIVVPFFDDFYRNPPPVTQIRQPPPAGGGQPQTGGPTVIQIPSGASVQGNPSYDPDNAEVPIEGPGSEIVWDNLDSVPHTATSGTGNSDPEKGKLFDTGIINANEKSANIVLEGVSEGDIIDYFCTVHEYMKGQLTIVAAGGGAQSGGGSGQGGNQTGGSGNQSGAGAAAGPAINILEGASVQGSPDYDPDPLTAKKGDEINVVNKDNIPHTVTSGTSNGDPEKGKLFDTNIITGGESAKISLVEVDPGEYDYFCIVHEYMKGKLIVE